MSHAIYSFYEFTVFRIQILCSYTARNQLILDQYIVHVRRSYFELMGKMNHANISCLGFCKLDIYAFNLSSYTRMSAGRRGCLLKIQIFRGRWRAWENTNIITQKKWWVKRRGGAGGGRSRSSRELLCQGHCSAKLVMTLADFLAGD